MTTAALITKLKKKISKETDKGLLKYRDPFARRHERGAH